MNLSLLLFVLLCCNITSALQSINKREDFESVYDKVKKSLVSVQGHTKTALESLETLKGYAKKVPSKSDKIKSILGTVESSLGKLKSGDAATVVSGCLDIVSGIATTFGGPVGIGIGAVASFISSIISMFSGGGGGGKSPVEKIIEDAMKRYRDQDLNDEAAGAKRDFAESTAFIEILKKSKKITSTKLSILAANVPIYKFSSFLGKLESRISLGAVTNDLAEARRTMDFIVLYCQLVVMRETLLMDLYFLYKIPGTADDIAEAVNNANKVNRKFAKEHLSFLHNVKAENALIASLYYPINHSEKTKGILAYAYYFGVQKPPSLPFPGHHRFQNVYFDKWSICSEAYMNNWMFRGCPHRTKRNILVSRRPNGYYTMANWKKKTLYITKHQQGWAWGTSSNDPGPQGYLNFIPLTSGNYMISTQKWPDFFIYMESSANGYVRSWKGNPGPQGYWKII